MARDPGDLYEVQPDAPGTDDIVLLYYLDGFIDAGGAGRLLAAHLLSTLSYHDVQRVPLELPPRPKSTGYVRAPRDLQTFVPDYVATLLGQHSGTGRG